MLLSRTAWGLFFDGVPTPKRLRLADPKWDAPAKPVKVKRKVCEAGVQRQLDGLQAEGTQAALKQIELLRRACVGCGRCDLE